MDKRLVKQNSLENGQLHEEDGHNFIPLRSLFCFSVVCMSFPIIISDMPIYLTWVKGRRKMCQTFREVGCPQRRGAMSDYFPLSIFVGFSKCFLKEEDQKI